MGPSPPAVTQVSGTTIGRPLSPTMGVAQLMAMKFVVGGMVLMEPMIVMTKNISSIQTMIEDAVADSSTRDLPYRARCAFLALSELFKLK